MPLPTSGKGFELLIIQICCGIIVYVSVCLRLLAQYINRRRQSLHSNTIRRNLSLHDVLLHLAVLFYTIQAVIVVRGIIDGGIGRHANDINRAEVIIGFQTWYFGELVYPVLSCLTKTSMIFFLQQAYIIKSQPREATKRRYIEWVFYICLCAIWTSSNVFLSASIFQCSPPTHYWMQFENSTKEGTCSKSIVPTVGIILSIVTAAGDWALASVPIVALTKSQIPWRKKATIQALSSLGVLAGIFMIIRVPQIRTLELTEDFLYETVDVAKWTIIEAAVGIIATCLPTTGPLLRLVMPRRTPPVTSPFPMTSSYRVHAERGRRVNKNIPRGKIYVNKSFSCHSNIAE